MNDTRTADIILDRYHLTRFQCDRLIEIFEELLILQADSLAKRVTEWQLDRFKKWRYDNRIIPVMRAEWSPDRMIPTTSDDAALSEMLKRVESKWKSDPRIIEFFDAFVILNYAFLGEESEDDE